jgi:hypothetical protein
MVVRIFEHAQWRWALNDRLALGCPDRVCLATPGRSGWRGPGGGAVDVEGLVAAAGQRGVAVAEAEVCAGPEHGCRNLRCPAARGGQPGQLARYYLVRSAATLSSRLSVRRPSARISALDTGADHLLHHRVRDPRRAHPRPVPRRTGVKVIITSPCIVWMENR